MLRETSFPGNGQETANYQTPSFFYIAGISPSERVNCRNMDEYQMYVPCSTEFEPKVRACK
jgi:hypothetical protein